MEIGMVGLGRMGMNMVLFERFSSRGEADFADKVLSALRYEFGGHKEKTTGGA